MNTVKVWILMAGLTVLLVLLGRAVGGTEGAALFLLIAVGLNFFGYFYSDKIAIKMTRSRPLEAHEAPEIHDMIERLSYSAGLPKPRVYLSEMTQPNAFETGRNPQNAVVAVTSGLMRVLDRREIEGVLAHEMAHIKNRDILVGAIAAALAGAITLLANVVKWGFIFGTNRSGGNNEGVGSLAGALVAVIVAPIAAMLIQFAISRQREYQADAIGAKLAGGPGGLADALLKLEETARQVPARVNPATSHMFIVNPLRGQELANLFSTHPPIQERVARLRRLPGY